MALPSLPQPKAPTPTGDDIEQRLRLKGIGRVLRRLGLMRLEDTEDVGLENLKVKMAETPLDVLGGLRKLGRNPDSETFIKSLKPDIGEGGLNTIFGAPPPLPPVTPPVLSPPITPIPQLGVSDKVTAQFQMPRPIEEGELRPREAIPALPPKEQRLLGVEEKPRPLLSVEEEERIKTFWGQQPIPPPILEKPLRAIGETAQSQVGQIASGVVGGILLGIGGAQAIQALTPLARQAAGAIYSRTLGESLDAMITKRAAGIPKEQFNAFQNTIYDWFAANKTAVQESARNRFLARLGRTPNVSQAMQEAADDTAADIERVIASLIPKGTQTGAMAQGGLPKPTVYSVAGKLADNIPLTASERQLYASQSQAVEDVLKGMQLPVVREVEPQPVVSPLSQPQATVSELRRQAESLEQSVGQGESELRRKRAYQQAHDLRQEANMLERASSGVPEIYKSPMGRELPTELNKVKEIANSFEVNSDGSIDFVVYGGNKTARQVKQTITAIEQAGYDASVIKPPKIVGLRGAADGTSRQMGIVRAIPRKAVKEPQPVVSPEAPLTDALIADAEQLVSAIEKTKPKFIFGDLLNFKAAIAKAKATTGSERLAALREVEALEEKVRDIAKMQGAKVPEMLPTLPAEPAKEEPPQAPPAVSEPVTPKAEGIIPEAVIPPPAERVVPPVKPPEPPADVVSPPPVEPPIDIIPPPVTPAPGERIMGDLQNADELATTMTNPDVFRKLARLPGLSSVLKYLNPAGVAESPAEKAVILRAALREEGQNKAIGAFSTLEQLGKRDKVWGKADWLQDLESGTFAGKPLDEILTYRTKYRPDMTPEQKAWADQFHAIERDKLDFLKRNGITINELSFEEGGEYVGRRVAGRLDDTGNLVDSAFIGSPGPGRPGMKMGAEKTRVFKDINEAVEQGFRYLPSDEALFLNIKGAYNRVADKQMADWVLERIPWRTSASPETLIIARDRARARVATSVRIKNLLNRAVRGERVPIDSTLAKTLPEETAELRSLVDLLQKGEPTAERVMALTQKLNAIVKQAKTDMRDAADKLAKAHEQAARAHLGEASVQAPAFAGKILTGKEARQNAETLSRAFNAQYGDLDRILMSVNKVNSIGRYFMLAGDASALTIQLIGFSVRFPRIWSKSAVSFTKALFSEKSQAAYLAKNNAIIQQSRNLILTKGGQTEYTEAFRSGGLLSKGPAKLLVPFQRGFEAAMDTAGIELRKAFDHLADTPQHIAEVEQFINEFRGVTSSARIGVSPQLRQFETAVFLAPRYNRAVAALLSDVARGGIRGDQARKAIVAMIGGTIALAVAITLARGEGWDELVDHLNPQSKNFMTWEIAGQRIGPGAKFRSLMALAGKITKEPERTVELTANFVRAQFAPLLSTSIDIINGRDYVGEPTRPGKPLGFGKEVGFTEGMLGLSRRVIADNLLPLSLNSFLMEGGDFAGRVTRGVIEFVGGRAYPSRTDEAKDVIDKAFIQLGKEDVVGLENALKGVTNTKKIAEIRAKDHTYDITSLRRDISDAIRYIDPKDITEKNGFNPLAMAYVEFDKVDDEYEALSAKEQEQFVKSNPDYITNRLFWGDSNLRTIPDLKTAEALAAKAKQSNISLNMIPAFQLTDKGKERIPSDRELWKPYFDYNDLPGTSYLNFTFEQVDADELPEKYRKDWETYQKLTTDRAKTAFREARNKKGGAAYGGWRDDFRRANPEFDKWLQEHKDLKPLPKKASKANVRSRSASSFSGGFRPSSGRRKLAMPTFPKARISTGVSI